MRTPLTASSLLHLTCLAVFVGGVGVLATEGQDNRGNVAVGRQPSKRVRPPVWQPGDADEIFFRDAFRDALVGTRPPNLVGGTKRVVVSLPGNPAPNQPTAVPGPGWSTIISAATIEDEIKALAQQLDQSVTAPAKFASRGYVDARTEFSLLALLFAIVSEYDGDIRWRNQAAIARDRFLQMASISKVGTIQVYNAAKIRKAELDDLVRGGSIGTKPSNAVDSWPQMMDRGPLMERLETARQVSIEPTLASAAALRGATDRLVHEAELIAAVGHVLTRDGMEDANDSDYVEYCEQLKRAARDMIRAVKQNDYNAARGAAGDISKSCINCHENYRG